MNIEGHGPRRLQELYEHLNPMPFEAAAQMEKDLRENRGERIVRFAQR
jgi:hypothetical protein